MIEGFGSLGKALRFLAEQKGPDGAEDALAQAEQARIADLEVYFALQQFSRRRAYKHLDAGLQRDIKAFFGDYPAALEAGRVQLFRIADTEAIAAACRSAAEHGLGWLDPGASLQLHSRLVEQLPALLRVYVGAASMLYGDIREADLVKIHIGSGKLSLMRYDDFEGRALPRMVERVKIKLREQDIDYFAYGEDFEPPYLYRKSRYINEECDGYPEQLAFDEALAGLGVLPASGYGPAPAAFDALLERRRWTIEDKALVRSRDDPGPGCALRAFSHLSSVDRMRRDARPRPGSPTARSNPRATRRCAIWPTQVLDPVIEYFGMIRLTYGFCSATLGEG